MRICMFASLIGPSISGNRTAPLSELEGERRTPGRRWGGTEGEEERGKGRERGERLGKQLSWMQRLISMHQSTGQGTRGEDMGVGEWHSI